MEELRLDDSINLLNRLSTIVGASEAAIRLLVSILIGYPICLAHRHYLYGKTAEVQHVFFFFCGFILGYFNFGLDVFHSFVTVCLVYCVLKVIPGTISSVIIILVFTMTYLLIGYHKTSSETYEINWTMPQCVLTLRLTGLAIDLYDGKQPVESLSVTSKKLALTEVPSLLEVYAHVYFPGSFLVGPQFPMRRYKDYIATKFSNPGTLPDCLNAAGTCLGLGLIYLVIFQVGYIYFNDNYLLSPEFEAKCLISRLFFMGIWGHVALYKYVCIWKICEGVCVTSGITHNGVGPDGNAKWDGCKNIDIKTFEGATNFGHYVESFNINTNQWVLQYIYKRLKFLGNKYLSQIGVLLFLALWHGFNSGYYMCFFMEFVCLVMEKDLTSILNKNMDALEFLNRSGAKQLTWVILKLYTLVFMGYCMAPFVLLSIHKWFRVYMSVFFIGHVLWMGWLGYKPLVIKLLPPKEGHPKSR
uniref:Lysophospholipid acyltransferase 5 n=1 Tax=Clastoptera arizonana TaxID=38151 RepID=A0A1B6D3K0_9HEMI